MKRRAVIRKRGGKVPIPASWNEPQPFAVAACRPSAARRLSTPSPGRWRHSHHAMAHSTRFVGSRVHRHDRSLPTALFPTDALLSASGGNCRDRGDVTVSLPLKRAMSAPFRVQRLGLTSTRRNSRSESALPGGIASSSRVHSKLRSPATVYKRMLAAIEIEHDIWELPVARCRPWSRSPSFDQQRLHPVPNNDVAARSTRPSAKTPRRFPGRRYRLPFSIDPPTPRTGSARVHTRCDRAAEFGGHRRPDVIAARRSC